MSATLTAAAANAADTPVYYCYTCNFITTCVDNADHEPQCIVCHLTYVEQQDTHTINDTNNNHNDGNATQSNQSNNAPLILPFNSFTIIQSAMNHFISPHNTTSSTQQSNGMQMGDYYFGDMTSLLSNLMNIDHSRHYGPPPASSQAINNLHTINIQQSNVDQHDECTVCLERFQLNEAVKQLPCNHIFHDSCITNWLKLHSTCCTCRKSIEPQSNNTTQSHGQSSHTQQYTRRVHASNGVNIPHI